MSHYYGGAVDHDEEGDYPMDEEGEYAEYGEGHDPASPDYNLGGYDGPEHADGGAYGGGYDDNGDDQEMAGQEDYYDPNAGYKTHQQAQEALRTRMKQHYQTSGNQPWTDAEEYDIQSELLGHMEREKAGRQRAVKMYGPDGDEGHPERITKLQDTQQTIRNHMAFLDGQTMPYGYPPSPQASQASIDRNNAEYEDPNYPPPPPQDPPPSQPEAPRGPPPPHPLPPKPQPAP